MQSCNVAAQIIKAIAAGLAGAVKIYTVEFFHNVNMVGHFVFRYHRFPKTLDLYIFAVITSNWHRRINDIWDHQHSFPDFSFKLCLQSFQILQLLIDFYNLCLCLFSFILLSLGHKAADLLADGVTLCSQGISLSFGVTVLSVHFDNFIHQNQFFILKLFSDVFLHKLWIGTQ